MTELSPELKQEVETKYVPLNKAESDSFKEAWDLAEKLSEAFDFNKENYRERPIDQVIPILEEVLSHFEHYDYEIVPNGGFVFISIYSAHWLITERYNHVTEDLHYAIRRNCLMDSVYSF